jgi:hypothetical protein
VKVYFLNNSYFCGECKDIISTEIEDRELPIDEWMIVFECMNKRCKEHNNKYYAHMAVIEFVK